MYVSGSDYVTTNYSGNAVRFANLRSFQSSALLPSLIVRDDKSRQGSMLDIVVSLKMELITWRCWSAILNVSSLLKP